MSSTSMLGCGHGGIQYEQRVDVSTVRWLSSTSGMEGSSMVNMIDADVWASIMIDNCFGNQVVVSNAGDIWHGRNEYHPTSRSRL
jgi:hypothetical protein